MVIFDWWATKPELAFTFISDSSGNLRCEICKKKFMEGQPVYAVWIYDIEWAHQSCVRLNKLCPTCHGRGYVGEPDLRSLFSGWIANPDKKCKDCRGKGHVRCS